MKYIVINCSEEGDSYYIAQYALTEKGIAIFQLCYDIDGMNLINAIKKAQQMNAS